MTGPVRAQPDESCPAADSQVGEPADEPELVRTEDSSDGTRDDGSTSWFDV